MFVKVQNPATGGGHRHSVRCPHCGHVGTFSAINNVSDLHVQGYWLTQRECPNPQCRGHLFIVTNDAQEILKTYPALRIDFDPANIPDRIVKSLREALTCHAEGCNIAAAIMIRRCLEELCDERGAQGNNL